MDVSILPTINACLNAVAAVFLALGWKAIRSGKKDAHKNFMLAALFASVFFLCTYLTYHALVPGVTRYQGTGFWRIIYFTILLTHTPLAALIVPFCILAVYFAVKGDFIKHVKITKWLFPTWLYVSVTGVVIYLMLYVL